MDKSLISKYMNKYINNTTQKDIVRDIKIIFASIVIMSFFIFFTNPFSMPIYMLFIIPVLSSIIVFYIADALCSFFFKFNKKVRIIINLSIAFFALTLILLGSLKQLSLQDFVLVMLLVLGVSLYSLKANFEYSETWFIIS